MNAKVHRQKAMVDARRDLILAAAERLLMREGMEKSTVREIAKEAGYTPGALYSYFDSRQQIFAAMLEAALGRFANAVESAVPAKGSVEIPLVLKGRAWLDYLIHTTLDRQLLMYAFLGTSGAGASAEVAAQLRAQIRSTLMPLAALPPLSGLEPDSLLLELDGIAAHAVGLLVMLGVGASSVGVAQSCASFEHYLQRLCLTYEMPAHPLATEQDKHASQIDLFG